MRRFEFRLQRVARVREIERDRARGDLATARQAQAAVEQRLEAARTAARAEPVGLAADGPIDLRAAAFRAGLRAQAVTIAVGDLTVAAEAVDAATARLQDAARRLDALDRLRASQHQAWLLAARRHEARVLDDVATTRAARRDREERPGEGGR